MESMPPERQLAGFMARFTPEVRALAKAVLAKMRKRLPGATEMVYDNYNGLVIGFSPNERPSDAIFSIVVFPKWVTLCFLFGAELDDPDNLLKGNGRQVRHMRLLDASLLDEPAVKTLMSRAVASSDVPFDRRARRRLVIRSISRKQRPRVPTR